MTSPLGFKARVGSALFALGGGICVTQSNGTLYYKEDKTGFVYSVEIMILRWFFGGGGVGGGALHYFRKTFEIDKISIENIKCLKTILP